MVKMKKSFYFLFLIGFQGLLSANLIDEGILMMSDNNNACLIYQPYLGTVKDIDNLDIKSDKFQINDEKVETPNIRATQTDCFTEEGEWLENTL